MFEAASIGVSAFVTGAQDAARKGSEPPYILIYKTGVLDKPSSALVNFIVKTVWVIILVLVFLLLGLSTLTIGVFVSSILVGVFSAPLFIYAIARKLRSHAELENKIRKSLGLSYVPKDAPGLGALIASILTGGLYLPIYAKKLVKSVNKHISTH